MTATAQEAAEAAFWSAFDDRSDHEPFTEAITAAADAVVGQRDAVIAAWLRDRAERYHGDSRVALLLAAEKLELGKL